ncbi:peptidoglycan-binding domain-containing protein [Lipingzhangella sp. LS1_29]|uniref:Peptidoglycan-binding domain-containing protein n=1 Tax=Lipingzhangella rawalii TaxID=2055835 RepID=A0ABU2H304_9ACTN|nr:peptidoglycan-binding domain-containing protein [Lipingzhangella rawalii]MDS1269683.1 peptidoglycan-binding domain-containing protein [Lipingzhangella rawalii]
MATIENSLSGTAGSTPSSGSLAATARAGQLDILAPERAAYSAEHAVQHLSTIRLESGPHLGNTPLLEFGLPDEQWTVRFYAWIPPMPETDDEARLLLTVGDTHFLARASAGGTLQLRAQTALSGGLLSYTFSGTAQSVAEWVRLEVHRDGSDIVIRAYPEHDTSGGAVYTWQGVAPADTAHLGAYRYRHSRLYRLDDADTDFDGTPITDLQNALLDLGYELPVWGADGVFGNETAQAVERFQVDHGLLVDRIAGAQTLAVMDMELAEQAGDPPPAPVFLSHLVVQAGGGSVGPATAPQVRAHSMVPVLASADVDASVGVTGATTEFLAVGTATTVKRAVTTAVTTPVLLSGAVGAKGAQPVATFTTEVRGLAVVTQSVGLAVDYAAGHVSAPFEPVEDDQAIRNDVVVSGAGEDYRVTVTDGPLGTEAVGTYEESVELNVHTADQLPAQAGWRVHLGTHDDARYPTVRIDLTANPQLISTVATRDCGDSLQVLNPPEWLPPGPIELLVQGYEERINLHHWEVVFNASSGEPWLVAQVADAASSGSASPDRADTAGCLLLDEADANVEEVRVLTLTGPPWITTVEHPDDFPFDILCAGEAMRVHEVVSDNDSGAVQTLLVSRGINGIHKEHPAGTELRLAQPMTVAL